MKTSMMMNTIRTFNLNAFVDIIPVSVDCAEDAGTQAGACLLILVLSSVLLTPLARRGPAITLASEDSISKCLILIIPIPPVAAAVTRVVADLVGVGVSALSLPLVTVTTTTTTTTLGLSKKRQR